MLSNYFKCTTKKENFKKRIEDLQNNLKDKKVLIYGAGQGFSELNKQYKLTENLNIVAIADKKFEKNNSGSFLNLPSIKPSSIKSYEYDYILVSNENYKPIKTYLVDNLCINENIVITIFKEQIRDERENLNYLYKFHFNKSLPELIRKLKNKTVILYGADVFCEVIKEYFDISELNIIAIADKKYEMLNTEQNFLNYPIITPDKIEDLNPDYVLISTKYYIDIFEYLTEDLLKNTKIKVKPLVQKSFIALIRELWKF